MAVEAPRGGWWDNELPNQAKLLPVLNTCYASVVLMLLIPDGLLARAARCY